MQKKEQKPFLRSLRALLLKTMDSEWKKSMDKAKATGDVRGVKILNEIKARKEENMKWLASGGQNGVHKRMAKKSAQ